jgi:two-component system alkaline phosphatase synthesis response regulator PhoP
MLGQRQVASRRRANARFFSGLTMEGSDTAPLILVVDDDRPVARMVAATLSIEGFDVLVAHDGAEALAKVDNSDPDAILLDLQMPVMDGRELYKTLRNRGLMMPVVILSAYGAEVAQNELGAEGFVNKPFDPDDLVAELKQVLRTTPRRA